MLAVIAASIMMQDTLEFAGGDGPGKGKHVVLLAGDEEYRSEEMLPQFARILSERHGFKCTVGFPLNESGEVDPNAQTKQSGLDALATADTIVIMLRFRQWPESEMKKFVDAYLAGKPIIAIRTSTHAFAYPGDSPNPFRSYSWNDKEWHGGFGKQVLGETWVSHWGNHGKQATRGKAVAAHELLRGVANVFGPTDVYEAKPPSDAKVLMRGEIVEGMNPDDPTAKDRNDPMMPVVWTREIENSAGKTNRVFTTTMGSAQDFTNEGFRRLMVNAVFWSTNTPVPAHAEVGLVGEYKPSPFGFNTFRKGLKPIDFRG